MRDPGNEVFSFGNNNRAIMCKPPESKTRLNLLNSSKQPTGTQKNQNNAKQTVIVCHA